MPEVKSTKRVAPGRRVERICPSCGLPFMALRLEINRGAGIFCGTICYHKSRSRPLADRFWEKVQKNDDCWLWTASTQVDDSRKRNLPQNSVLGK